MTRLDAAINLARSKELDIRTGDAVADVAALVDEARRHGHPVVTTSWVMNYLAPLQRREFVNELDHLGANHDLSWVIAESPRETPELPVDGLPDEDITVISLVTWRRGLRTSQRLATTHPHGSWIKRGS